MSNKLKTTTLYPKEIAYFSRMPSVQELTVFEKTVEFCWKIEPGVKKGTGNSCYKHFMVYVTYFLSADLAKCAGAEKNEFYLKVPYYVEIARSPQQKYLPILQSLLTEKIELTSKADYYVKHHLKILELMLIGHILYENQKEVKPRDVVKLIKQITPAIEKLEAPCVKEAFEIFKKLLNELK